MQIIENISLSICNIKKDISNIQYTCIWNSPFLDMQYPVKASGCINFISKTNKRLACTYIKVGTCTASQIAKLHLNGTSIITYIFSISDKVIIKPFGSFFSCKMNIQKDVS